MLEVMKKCPKCVLTWTEVMEAKIRLAEVKHQMLEARLINLKGKLSNTKGKYRKNE